MFICLFSYVGNGDILRWAIAGSENANDGKTKEYISDVYSFLVPDENIGVRLAAYDKNGNFISYLHPLYKNPDDPYGAGTIDYEFDDEYIGTRSDLPAQTRQALYDGIDPYERLFQMQIGNYDEDDNFNPILFSEGIVVSSNYRYDPNDLGPSGMDWTVTDFYTLNPISSSVPEPTTNILFLIGISLLFLKRKISNAN